MKTPQGLKPLPAYHAVTGGKKLIMKVQRIKNVLTFKYTIIFLRKKCQRKKEEIDQEEEEETA